MKTIFALLLVLLMAAQGEAKVVTKTVEYQIDGAAFEGYLAYDDALPGKRPGVMLVHEWYGVNDFVKGRAEAVAGLGYVAFAGDMYGKGKVTQDPAQAGKWAGELRGADTSLLRKRAQAALKVLAGEPRVDPHRLAAIGFCFGGTTVLELAYSGADLAGIVSFHGGLTAPKPEDLKNIQARFLVLHGADDHHVTAKDIAAFQDGMRQAHADWQMIYYGDAVHSFTNPAAGNDKGKGVAYNAKAAARSWKHLQVFFDEILAPGAAPGK